MCVERFVIDLKWDSTPRTVPEQAGGAPAADQRTACQGVRAAGPRGQGPGAQQPEAGDGQPPGPAQDQQVWIKPWHGAGLWFPHSNYLNLHYESSFSSLN